MRVGLDEILAPPAAKPYRTKPRPVGLRRGFSYDNNGNVTRSETYIPNAGFAQDNYQYDSLNRLTAIVEKSNGGNASTWPDVIVLPSGTGWVRSSGTTLPRGYPTRRP